MKKNRLGAILAVACAAASGFAQITPVKDHSQIEHMFPADLQAKLIAEKPKPEANAAAQLARGNTENTNGHVGAAVATWRELVQLWPESVDALQAQQNLLQLTSRFEAKDLLAEMRLMERREAAMPAELKNRFRDQQIKINLINNVAGVAIPKIMELSRSADAGIRRRAVLRIAAAADAESTSAVYQKYLDAIALRESFSRLGDSQNSLKSFLSQAEGSQTFTRYISDAKVSHEERAELLYALALASSQVGNHEKSLEYNQRVFDTLAPRKPGDVPVVDIERMLAPGSDGDEAVEYCVMSPQASRPEILASEWGMKALFHAAFHAGHSGHYCHAVPLFKILSENAPIGSECSIPAHENWIKTMELSKDTLGAALACNQVMQLYPEHRIANKARLALANYNEMLKVEERKHLADQLEVQRVRVANLPAAKPQSAPSIKTAANPSPPPLEQTPFTVSDTLGARAKGSE